MRYVSLLAAVLLLCGLPAQAQEFTPPPMNDPLTLRLLCTGAQEWTDSGPGYSCATIYSVPEEGGERLYVGFVGDIRVGRSRHGLWRGPVAAYWEDLRPVPEYTSRLSAPNPTRYRLDRLTRLPDGRLDKAVMEIDLDAQPPQLRLVGGGPDQPRYLDSQLLGEEIPMSEGLRLLTRMRQEAKADTRVLGLRAYAVVLGDKEGFRDKPYWHKDSSKNPYLLAMCRKDDLSRSALHFLPPRISGWEFDRLLHAPRPGDLDGVFTARMFSLYWGPSVDGAETLLGSRSLVNVSLRGMEIVLVASQLEGDPETGEWTRPGPVKKRPAKRTTKP